MIDTTFVEMFCMMMIVMMLMKMIAASLFILMKVDQPITN